MCEKLIAEYLYNYWYRLNNERIQLQNNICYRAADELDYLEFIIILTREKELNKITKDMYDIFRAFGKDIDNNTK